MSLIDSTSEARAIGVGAKNEVFIFSGQNVQSKILIAAQYDPGKTLVIDNDPIRILSANDLGDKAGFGFPAHRIAIELFKGTNGAGEIWWSPQADPGGVVADGEIAWTGPATASGVISLRIANELYEVAVPDTTDIEAISDAFVALINADPNTPVIASKTAVTFETVLTAKSIGAHGLDITITLSANTSIGEALPTGVTGTITDMLNGTLFADIDDTLAGMGTAGTDDVNEKGFTQLIHNNGLDTDTMDKIFAYVGSANDFTGCWSKLVGRPFVSLTGDTTPDAAGLTALSVITDARLTNQAVGILAAPDEDEIPYEISALAAGIIGKIHQAAPAVNYSEQVLSGVGGRSVSAERWTNNYSSGRDFAVKNGISPTRVKSTQVFLQNVVTMYRPASVPTASNGWKSYVSFFVQLNIITNLRLLFEGEAYKGFFIVKDKSLVTNFEASKKARDLNDVITDLNNFIDGYLTEEGLIFDAEFAKANSTVTLRAAGNGFDIVLKDFESGEGQIINIEQTFDKNIAAA
jgi:phage tail sheath gpL-like